MTTDVVREIRWNLIERRDRVESELGSIRFEAVVSRSERRMISFSLALSLRIV